MPKLTFKRDGPRYIVMCGNDLVGFVAQLPDSKLWNAVDATISTSRNFRNRTQAADWLRQQLAKPA